MRQRGQTTSFQTRLEISEQAAAGLNDPQIATRVGCSVWTVRKWRRRSRHQGRVGFTSQMGRPATGPVSTFPTALKETILHLRQLHPGWGPDTLLVELKTDISWHDQPLPSRAQIARLLKHAGLTRRYQPHNDLLQPPRTELRSPHEEWQMDAQGIMRVEGVGKVSLITIVDVVSRLKAESYPSLETSNPALPDYQLSLRRAFLAYGLPQVLTLDHGTVFYDNTTPSPFPTKLHLWLLALGVQVRFTRKRCPTDHAIIERTHQTMTAQALLGQTYPSHADLWAGLDERREVLNKHLPSRALSHKAPMARLSARHPLGADVPSLHGRKTCYASRTCGAIFNKAGGSAAVATTGSFPWEAISTPSGSSLLIDALKFALILIPSPSSVNRKEVKRLCECQPKA